MRTRTTLCVLIGMSICSIVASEEQTVYTIYPEEVPIYHRWTGKSIDSLILQLVSAHPNFQPEVISAIKQMNIPSDQLLLRSARLSRLLFDSRVEFYHNFALRAQSSPIFELIDLDKALDGVLNVIRNNNRTVYDTNSIVGRRTDLARSVIDAIADTLRESKIQPLPGTVPLLTKALAEQDAEICEIAVKLLGCIPTDAKDTVPALFDALGHKSKHVRTQTVSTLEKIAAANPDVQSAIAAKLVDMLHAPSFVLYVQPHYHTHHHIKTDFHDRVAEVLLSIGPAAEPSLLNALDTTDAEVRYHAAIMLAVIDPEHAETTIPLLSEALASPTRRRVAVNALKTLALERPTLTTKIASIFREVLPKAPVPLDQDHDFWFHAHVHDALKQISPKTEDR